MEIRGVSFHVQIRTAYFYRFIMIIFRLIMSVYVYVINSSWKEQTKETKISES
jgi:hypothetical protein